MKIAHVLRSLCRSRCSRWLRHARGRRRPRLRTELARRSRGAEAASPARSIAQGTDVTLWNNVTARNIGDTLTIRLAESTEAEKSSTTTASKSSTATLTGPTVAGLPVTANGVPILEGSMDNQQDFSGNGAATQSNKLDGFITVTVVQAPVQRQPAGARPEVGRDQFRT